MEPLALDIRHPDLVGDLSSVKRISAGARRQLSLELTTRYCGSRRDIVLVLTVPYMKDATLSVDDFVGYFQMVTDPKVWESTSTIELKTAP